MALVYEETLIPHKCMQIWQDWTILSTNHNHIKTYNAHATFPIMNFPFLSHLLFEI